MIFMNGGVPLSTSTFSEILDEEVGETLSEFLCIMEISKRQF